MSVFRLDVDRGGAERLGLGSTSGGRATAAGALRSTETTHSLQSAEHDNVWWTCPLDALGRHGVDSSSLSEAKALLDRVKLHADPILRARGWRCKHLKEIEGKTCGGVCWHDGNGAADIGLRLRSRPDRRCNSFRPFYRIMSTMIHEITHISGLGLEDIHPPEFYEEMTKVCALHRRLLADGTIVDPDYNNNNNNFRGNNDDSEIARDQRCKRSRGRRGGWGRGWAGRGGGKGGSKGGSRCSGAKRPRTASSGGGAARRNPPLGKKRKMTDGRTQEGKRLAAQQASMSPSEAARRAALARFGVPPPTAAEARARAGGAAGDRRDAPIELSSDKEEGEGYGDGGEEGGMFDNGAFGPLAEPLDEDWEEDDDCGGGEAPVHDGPPGLCSCAACEGCVD